MCLMMSFLLLLAFGVAWPAVAQTANNEKEALETEVRELRKRISVLEQELRVVEERLSAAAPAPAPTQAVASEIPSDSQNDTKSSLPVDVSGYLSLRYFNDTSSEGVGSFQAHDVSLFFGKKLGNWRYFSEIEFEYAPGHSAAENSFSSARGLVMVETAWLNYTHRDWLKVSSGILLVPTYWRVHHYPSVTLSVQNPLIDKRIFPADVVGGMVHGSKYFESGGFDYSFYVGNGRGPDPGRKDFDDHKATGGTFLVHVPNRNFFETLDVGVQWYRDKLNPLERENIYGFETRMEKGSHGFLGEFAHANIGRNDGPSSFFREGFYLQPWYRLSPKVRLFYRYDKLNFDSRFSHGNDASRHTTGINVRPIPSVSLKLELHRSRSDNQAISGFYGLAAGVALFLQ